jgi:hypothetical protein
MRSKSKVEEWMNKPGESTESEDEGGMEDSEDGEEGEEDEGQDFELETIDRKVFGSRAGERVNYLRNELKITTSCE